MLYCILLYGRLISRAVIGRFQVRKEPYGPPALDQLSKRQMISFFSRNNQQSHTVNILLASFAWSVRQVMDPRFCSFLVFHLFFIYKSSSIMGLKCFRSFRKKKEKTRSTTRRTDQANECIKRYVLYCIVLYLLHLLRLPLFFPAVLPRWDWSPCAVCWHCERMLSLRQGTISLKGLV